MAAARADWVLMKERLVCFYFLLLLQLVFPATVISVSNVRYLPGFTGPLPFELTGYVNVDEITDAHYFYYFVKSERNPREDPLLIWLSGGPGCSGFAGLVLEIGPIQFNVVEYNGSLPTLQLNPYSWTKVANIIFPDQPIGSGFSYSGTCQGSITGDIISTKQTYNFIRQWLIDHPEFVSNPLYVCGDSYSGITVPIVLQHISDGIEAKQQPLINLKGYILGNPVTDGDIDGNARLPFAHRMGLVSDELFMLTRTSCEGEYINVNPSNVRCHQNLQATSECTSKINTMHILEPLCDSEFELPNERVSYRRSFKENSRELPLSTSGLECRNYVAMLICYWGNDDGVQNALHIRKGTTRQWKKCNRNIPYTYDVQSTINYHLNLSNKGYRSLIYSGDHDMSIPHLGTQEWIRSLKYSIVDDWRPWFLDRQVAGYCRTFSNFMTFATIKGAGHMLQNIILKNALPCLRDGYLTNLYSKFCF